MKEGSRVFKALIVDDELSGNDLKNQLEGFDLDIKVIGLTGDGRAAVHLASDEKPDIIFADIYLPAVYDMDFLDVIRDRQPHTPIVVVTGREDFEHVRHALQLKVFDYLLKPVASRQLYKTCRNAMGLSKNCLSDRSRFSPLAARITNYIENHYGMDLSIHDVAREYHISASYIGRLLRKELACSFVQYLTNVRIEAAKKLLIENPFLKIRQISEKVGFGDQHYFSSIFKKAVGLSPSEYREKNTHSAV